MAISNNIDFQFFPPPPQEISPYFPSPVVDSFPAKSLQQVDGKKRPKFIRVDTASSSDSISKPKYVKKKPDPSAPKITRPCSECGKKFWSWKALFGHMRCHPERQWRGINPPPNFQRPISPRTPSARDIKTTMTEDEHEVASCLLLLANGPATLVIDSSNSGCSEIGKFIMDAASYENDSENASPSTDVSCRFECSSCKKVFGSHQALGGHRATHKNVKGCFAITKTDAEELDHSLAAPDGEETLKENMDQKMTSSHTCDICSKAFPSGQALGGHKRCHWENKDTSCDLDLNLPAPPGNESPALLPSGLTLELRMEEEEEPGDALRSLRPSVVSSSIRDNSLVPHSVNNFITKYGSVTVGSTSNMRRFS